MLQGEWGPGVAGVGVAEPPLEALRRRAGIVVKKTIRRDPQAIADDLAAAIRSDLRAGAVVPLEAVERIRYAEDPPGKDQHDPPEVTAARGIDDCDGLVRVWAPHRGVAVGAIRTPTGGFHVFLVEASGGVFDPCVAAGMGPVPPEAYRGAAVAAYRADAASPPVAASAVAPASPPKPESLAAVRATVEKVLGADAAGPAAAVIELAAAVAVATERRPLGLTSPGAAARLDPAPFREGVPARLAGLDERLERAGRALLLVTSEKAAPTVRVLLEGVAKGEEAPAKLRQHTALVFAAALALRALGYALPYEAAAPPAPPRPAPPAPPVSTRAATDAALLADLRALEDLAGFVQVGGCPGTCAVR